MNWNKLSNDFADIIIQANALENLLSELGLNFEKELKRVPCPVHGGADSNFVLYRNSDGQVPVVWKCFSNHCEKEFKPSLLGLVRALLTVQKDGVWPSGRPKVSLGTAAKHLEEFCSKLDGMPRVPRLPPYRPAPMRLTREQVRGRLEIPSPYFVSLGFAPAVLDEMDIGHSPKLGRSVVPFYETTGEVCIGFLTRAERPACTQCKLYHAPTEECKKGRGKWMLPPGFSKSAFLYNYAAALRSDSRTVLLVEGVKEVWRAREAGILAVSCLGSDLSAEQAKKLAGLGKVVLLAFDNDRAGKEGRGRARDRLCGHGLFADQFFFPPQFKDLAEMTAPALAECFRATTSPKP